MLSILAWIFSYPSGILLISFFPPFLIVDIPNILKTSQSEPTPFTHLILEGASTAKLAKGIYTSQHEFHFFPSCLFRNLSIRVTLATISENKVFLLPTVNSFANFFFLWFFFFFPTSDSLCLSISTEYS